jgi:DNA repair exonuclease SbcCD ATPase subunit
VKVQTLRTLGLPGVASGEVELPGGLVAVVAADGRIRRALARILLGDDSGPGTGVVLVPRVPDPVLARLPDGLLHRLRTGLGLTDVDQVVEAGARALAWSRGLDRLEAARGRLARIQAGDGGVTASGAEALLARIRALEGTPAELAGLESELRELRGDDVEVTGDLEQAAMEWLRERQDAETHLQAYRDRARELRGQLEELTRTGTDADCPTCGRPLADHVAVVREALEDEWEAVVQDGSWWRRRREQLELKPPSLQELERKALRVHAATEELGERVEGVRFRVRELEDLRAQLAALTPQPQRPGAGEVASVSREAWEAVDRALAGASQELKGRARAQLLDRMSTFLGRITAGRVLAVSWSEQGHLVLEGIDGPLHPPAEEDAAGAQLAARLAAVELVWEGAGASGAGIVVADPFDHLDEGARVRALDLFRDRGRRSGFSQIVVLTRGEIVDLFPEGFDAVLEFRGDGSGVTRLAAGAGVLRLSQAGQPVG